MGQTFANQVFKTCFFLLLVLAHLTFYSGYIRLVVLLWISVDLLPFIDLYFHLLRLSLYICTYLLVS